MIFAYKLSLLLLPIVLASANDENQHLRSRKLGAEFSSCQYGSDCETGLVCTAQSLVNGAPTTLEKQCHSKPESGNVSPPLLRYTFEDWKESMTGGRSEFDLITPNEAPDRSNDSVLQSDSTGTYLHCDGVGDFALTRDNLGISNFGDHSLSVWVRLGDLGPSGGGTMAIDGNYGASGGGDEIDYRYKEFDSIVYNRVADRRNWLIGSEFFQRSSIHNYKTHETQTNQWIHMVAVFDVHGHVVTLYRNGQVEQSFTPKKGFFTDYTNARVMFCQRHYLANGSDFVGDVALGELYDYALSAEDVAALYDLGSAMASL